MCRAGGRRCKGSGRATTATLTRRKQARQFRRDLAARTLAVSGDKALAQQIMDTPPSAMGALITAANMDPRIVTAAPIPNEQNGYQISDEQQALADRVAEAYEGRDELGMTPDERLAAVGPLGTARFDPDDFIIDQTYAAADHGEARVLTDPHYFGDRAENCRRRATHDLHLASQMEKDAAKMTPRCETGCMVSDKDHTCQDCGTEYTLPRESIRCPGCGKFVAKFSVAADDALGGYCPDCGRHDTGYLVEDAATEADQARREAAALRYTAREALQEAEAFERMQATDDEYRDALLAEGMAAAADPEGTRKALDRTIADTTDARERADLEAMRAALDSPAPAAPLFDPETVTDAELDRIEGDSLDMISAIDTALDADDVTAAQRLALTAARRAADARVEKVDRHRAAEAARPIPPFASGKDAEAVIDADDADAAQKILDERLVSPAMRERLATVAGDGYTAPTDTEGIRREYDSLLAEYDRAISRREEGWSALFTEASSIRRERDEALVAAARIEDGRRSGEVTANGKTFGENLAQAQSLGEYMGLDRDVTTADLRREAEKMRSSLTNPRTDSDMLHHDRGATLSEHAAEMDRIADGLGQVVQPGLSDSLRAAAETVSGPARDDLLLAAGRSAAAADRPEVIARRDALRNAAAVLREPSLFNRARRHESLSLAPAAYASLIRKTADSERSDSSRECGGKYIVADDFLTGGGSGSAPEVDGAPVIPDTGFDAAYRSGEVRRNLWNQVEAITDDAEPNTRAQRAAVVALRDQIDAAETQYQRTGDPEVLRALSRNLSERGESFIRGAKDADLISSEQDTSLF